MNLCSTTKTTQDKYPGVDAAGYKGSTILPEVAATWVRKQNRARLVVMLSQGPVATPCLHLTDRLPLKQIWEDFSSKFPALIGFSFIMDFPTTPTKVWIVCLFLKEAELEHGKSWMMDDWNKVRVTRLLELSHTKLKKTLPLVFTQSSLRLLSLVFSSLSLILHLDFRCNFIIAGVKFNQDNWSKSCLITSDLKWASASKFLHKIFPRLSITISKVLLSEFQNVYCTFNVTTVTFDTYTMTTASVGRSAALVNS